MKKKMKIRKKEKRNLLFIEKDNSKLQKIIGGVMENWGWYYIIQNFSLELKKIT
jgi:hypothetical protein